MKKLLISLIFSLIFYLLNPLSILAVSPLFTDDFSDLAKTNTQWEAQSGNWSSWGLLMSNWNVESESYKTTINSAYRASVTLAGDLNWNNYKIFADVKSGDGVDQSLLFRVQNSGTFYGLDIRAKWADQGIETLGNILLYKWVNGNQSVLAHYPYDIHNNEWYKLKIAIDGPNINVIVQDKNENLTPFSFSFVDSEINSGKIGLQSWSGQFIQMYPSSTVEKYFDNIIVLGLLDPDPVQFPIPLYPIIILPGLGASWNKCVLTGCEAPQGEWGVPSFARHYDGLEDTIVNAGYTKGKNVFVFAYDWRKPLDQIADSLKTYVETVVEPQNPGLPINFVGHSLGGLVARSYSQKYGNEKVNKIVSVGSPHNGAIQSYLAWAGGEIHEDQPWMQIAFQLLLQANKTGFQTDADVFRDKILSIRDILPTFDYLQNNTTPFSTIPLSSMRQENSNPYLTDLNLAINSDFLDIFTAIYGEKGNTPNIYRVSKPSWLEKTLNLWQDGKPVSTQYSSGDLAVLSSSGKIESGNSEIVTNANHTELVTTERGIQKIMDVLGLSPSSIVTYPDFDFSRGLLFFSPMSTQLEINGPSGNFSDDNSGIITIPSPLQGEYLVKLTGSQNNPYSFFYGQKNLDSVLWNNFQGTLTSGQTTQYRFTYNPNSPNFHPISNSTALNYLRSAKAKLQNLPNPSKSKIINHISSMISLLEKDKKMQVQPMFVLLLEKIFDYRKENPSELSSSITNDSFIDIHEAYVLFSNTIPLFKQQILATTLYDGSRLAFNGSSRLLEALATKNKITKKQAFILFLSEEYLNKAKMALKNKEYPRSVIYSQTSLFLSKEAMEK